MTSEEINAMIHKLEFGVSSVKQVICTVNGEDYVPPVADYCNNPSAMWPIMIREGISVIKSIHGYIALIGDADEIDNGAMVVGDSIRVADRKPLRAAAIVFLKMKGAI